MNDIQKKLHEAALSAVQDTNGFYTIEEVGKRITSEMGIADCKWEYAKAFVGGREVNGILVGADTERAYALDEAFAAFEEWMLTVSDRNCHSCDGSGTYGGHDCEACSGLGIIKW